MHIRRFDVAKEVPIGNLSSPRGISEVLQNGSPHGQSVGADVPEDERRTFDVWLRDRWTEKDQLMQRFHDTGSFSSSLEKHPKIDVPIQLRHNREILDAFCFFIPPIIGFAWAQIRRLTP
jgi:Acyltransferase C-terminus